MSIFYPFSQSFFQLFKLTFDGLGELSTSTEAVADKTASPIADRPQDAEEKVVQDETEQEAEQETESEKEVVETSDASEAEDISHQKEAPDLSQTDTAGTEEPEPEKESLEAEYPLTEADTDESE